MGNVDWIHLAQGVVRWWALVSTVKKLRFLRVVSWSVLSADTETVVWSISVITSAPKNHNNPLIPLPLLTRSMLKTCKVLQTVSPLHTCLCKVIHA